MIPSCEPMAIANRLKWGHAAMFPCQWSQIGVVKIRSETIAQTSGRSQAGKSILGGEQLDGVLLGQAFRTVELEELDLFEVAPKLLLGRVEEKQAS